MSSAVTEARNIFLGDCTKGKINNAGLGGSLYVGFCEPVWAGGERGMDVKTAYGMDGKRSEARRSKLKE
jgi:hypothetical protein